MNEILEFYQQQAKEQLSTIPWLAQLQSSALNHLNRNGFPTRHDEEWKYTLVDALLKQSFTQQQSAKGSVASVSDVPVKQQLLIQNGFIADTNEWIKKLPQGVLVLPLATALTTHEELIKPYLGGCITAGAWFSFPQYSDDSLWCINLYSQRGLY